MCKYKFRRQFLRTAVPLLLTVSMMLTGCGQTGNSDSLVRPILPDNSPDSSTVSSGEKLPDPVTIVVEDDSTPPAEGMVRSRLTNEWRPLRSHNTVCPMLLLFMRRMLKTV